MGTEEFWIPAALSAIGTGAQYVNQQNATSRSNAAEVNAINNQEQLRGQANNNVNQLTKQIATNTPAQIAAAATGQYVNTLRKNAAGSTQGGSTTGDFTNSGQSVSALPNVVGASSQYKKATGASQQDIENYGNDYAQTMGAIDSAVRQRQNEGLGMQTLGVGLNGLGAQSYQQNFVDQLRAQAGGQTNPYASLFGNLLTKNAGNFGQLFAPSGNSPYFNGNTNQLTGEGAQSILANL